MAVINTNSLSLMTQTNLNKSQSSLGTAIERLSSGLRINSAKMTLLARQSPTASPLTSTASPLLRVTLTTVSLCPRPLKAR